MCMDQGIDLLNRSEFVDRVVQIVDQLSENEKGSCFSIEGSWGIGKTFVLNEIERKLKEEEEKYFLFHYNCWQNDYYEEPAVAVISAMKESVKKDQEIINSSLEDAVSAGYQFVGEKFKEIAGVYLENKIGINLINWAQEISTIKENKEKAELAFDQMFGFSQAIRQVRKIMAEIAEERTIVLIVDELDRCIPQYAIKVLERLHHIFYELDNVVVIMAIDRKQLEHSVEEMFGMKSESNSMDVERYLKKFIDFSMLLDYGSMNEYYREKYPFYFGRFLTSSKDKVMLDDFLPPLLEGIDIRRIEKMIEKANIVHSVICKNSVDISVLAFEMLYEILVFLDVESKECIVYIDEKEYTDFEKLGEKRVELFRQLTKKSMLCSGSMFDDNCFTRMVWYFGNLFCPETVSSKEADRFFGFRDQYTQELELVRKYCEFREIIK